MHAPVKVDNELYVRDYSKCILCYKCVDACGEQYQNTFAIHVAGRGFDARISTEYVAELPESACVYCGNCIAVCPTGALMFRSEHELREAGRVAGGRADGDDDGVPLLRRRLQPRAARAGQHDREGDEPGRPRRHARQPLHQGPLRLPARPGARQELSVRAGGVVLAGGRSSRMGRPKALLEWDGRTAVEHAVAVVREGVDGGPVCVVRAPGQELPALDALVAEDPVVFAGPLAALTEGLAALAGRCEVAFACGVDTPLVVPALVRAVVRSLREGDDAVVPVIGGRAQPLLAAYRVDLAPRLGELLVQGLRGLKDVPGTAAVRALSEAELLADDELAAADPELRSARNANTPEEWAALEDFVLNHHKLRVRRAWSRGRVCVESTQSLVRAAGGRREAAFTASAGRLGLHLAALHEERLAVVELDGEASVFGDRAGGAAAAVDPDDGAVERVPPLELGRDARRARASSQAS